MAPNASKLVIHMLFNEPSKRQKTHETVRGPLSTVYTPNTPKMQIYDPDLKLLIKCKIWYRKYDPLYSNFGYFELQLADQEFEVRVGVDNNNIFDNPKQKNGHQPFSLRPLF